MSEEFSKLSIKSKSLTSCQNMHWVIPQSRINQQCPFLEREYPYFTTDFSMLHHQNPEIELKWKLVLERHEGFVTVNLMNVNDKSIFTKKEMKNVDVRWSIQIHRSINPDGYSTSSNQDVPGNSNTVFSEAIDFQSLHMGMAKPVPICDVFDFDSLCVNGKYTFGVSIEIEYFQQERKKLSMLQQAKKYSSSISEISSIYSKVNKTRESLSSGFGILSSPSRSWIAKTLPNFKRKSMGKPRSDSHPTYQQCSVPPTPPMSHYYEEFRSQATPTCPPAFYNYRQSEEVQLSDEHLISQGFGAQVDGVMIRRTKSGRLNMDMNSGVSITKADDTLDSRIASTQDLRMEDDPTYSSIPDNVFVTPQSNNTRYIYREQLDESPSVFQEQNPPFYCNVQRCQSTPVQSSYNSVNKDARTPFNDFHQKITPLNASKFFSAKKFSKKGHYSVNKNGSQSRTSVDSAFVSSSNIKKNVVTVSLNKLGISTTNSVESLDSVRRKPSHVSDLYYENNLIDSLRSGYIPDQSFIMKEKRNLLKIAVEHGLQKLMFKCEEAYLGQLKVSNCLETLLVLDNFVPKSMTKQKVLAFIRKNLDEVSRDQHWEEFVENCSSLVRSIQSRTLRDTNTLII